MNWKIALAIMSAAVFMMGGSYTMVIPFLPLFIARDLGAAPEDVNLLTGIAFSISFLITFVAAPILGKARGSLRQEAHVPQILLHHHDLLFPLLHS